MKEQITAKKLGIAIKLPFFLFIVRIVALLVLFLFLFVVWRYPRFFDFIADRVLFLSVIGLFAVANAVFTYFIPKLVKPKRFYSMYLYNMLWAVFLASIVYATGGGESYFSILLVFPIITTAFNLEAKAALILGVIAEVLLFLVMMVYPYGPHTPSYYAAGFINMGFLALVTYYLFLLIKEGVRQRFEKEESKRKYFDLVEIDRAKTEFITVTSHQLRTPMSELRWALNTLLETKRWDFDVENIVQKSVGSVNELVDITKSLMQVLRLEKPELMYRRVTVDLVNEIAAVIKSIKTEIAQKAVAVTFDPPIGDFILNGDPDYLKIALFNVIDNAVKYSPGGAVTIELTKKQNGIALTVRDTGIGISSQEQPQIFTKFFRASNALKIEPNETGVGLYITKRIIEKHNGTIDFVSEPGKGTTFTIFFPFLPIETVMPEKNNPI